MPPGVRELYSRFFASRRCGTVFWRGTHVRNTCRKLGIGPPADAVEDEPGG